jgi:hypothetical protein
MAARNMGIIWSPFSNLLLYGETLDIKAALQAGITVAIGSDWTPTGSRGVLDELRIARAYVKKLGLSQIVTDEKLYEMATENPAKLLNHYESKAGDGRHDLGRIAPDAAGSLVVLSRRQANPYTNFVSATAADVNLVVVDGRPVYGEERLLKQWDANGTFDEIPGALTALNSALLSNDLEIYPKGADKPTELAHLGKLARQPAIANAKPAVSTCAATKRMVRQVTDDDTVTEFKAVSGLDIDQPSDIAKTLAIGLVGQSYNRQPTDGKGDRAFAAKALPPMLSCDDADYTARVARFVVAEAEAMDEITKNAAERKSRRAQQGHKNSPKKFAESYGLPYDTNIDY